MRLGSHTNGISCEYHMHDLLTEFLTGLDLQFIHELHLGTLMGRIPDFLVWKPGNGLINIEAKCNDMDCMIRQLKDNSIYCDYSFAYIPNYCLTSRDFKRALFTYGFGLIIYNYHKKVITEVLEAHQNKNIDRKIQKVVRDKWQKESILRKKAEVIDTQQKLIL